MIILSSFFFQPSPFFTDQLTAFEVWLDHGSEHKKPPEQLPIVLQVQPKFLYSFLFIFSSARERKPYLFIIFAWGFVWILLKGILFGSLLEVPSQNCLHISFVAYLQTLVFFRCYLANAIGFVLLYFLEDFLIWVHGPWIWYCFKLEPPFPLAYTQFLQVICL